MSDEKLYTPEEAAELLKKQTKEKLAKYESDLKSLYGRELKKALVPSHKHNPASSTSAGIEDVPPSKLNPPGVDKGELEKVTPPGISETTMHKLKAQYPGEEEKAYATAWKMHNEAKAKQTKKALTHEMDDSADFDGSVGPGNKEPHEHRMFLAQKPHESNDYHEVHECEDLKCGYEERKPTEQSTKKAEAGTQSQAAALYEKHSGSKGNVLRDAMDEAGAQYKSDGALGHRIFDDGSRIVTNLRGHRAVIDHTTSKEKADEILANLRELAFGPNKAEACAKCGTMHKDLEKCGELTTQKSEYIQDDGEKLEFRNKDSILPGDKKCKEVSAEGSGGSILPGKKLKKKKNKEESKEELSKAESKTKECPHCKEIIPLTSNGDFVPHTVKGSNGKIVCDPKGAKNLYTGVDHAKSEPPMAKPPSGKNMATHMPTSKPAANMKPMEKGDFGIGESGKVSTLPPASAPTATKPKYTPEMHAAAKEKLKQQGISPMVPKTSGIKELKAPSQDKPAKPGIFGKIGGLGKKE